MRVSLARKGHRGVGIIRPPRRADGGLPFRAIAKKRLPMRVIAKLRLPKKAVVPRRLPTNPKRTSSGAARSVQFWKKGPVPGVTPGPSFQIARKIARKGITSAVDVTDNPAASARRAFASVFVLGEFTGATPSDGVILIVRPTGIHASGPWIHQAP